MTISMFRHKAEGKDRFFAIRGKKYLVIEMPAGEDLIDIYVGRIKKNDDYRFNKGRDISKLRAVGSKKEREQLEKILTISFYSEHRKDDYEINGFNFVGSKKSSNNPGPSYSTSGSIIPDLNEELV
jgi:hypothetical protein